MKRTVNPTISGKANANVPPDWLMDLKPKRLRQEVASMAQVHTLKQLDLIFAPHGTQRSIPVRVV